KQQNSTHVRNSYNVMQGMPLLPLRRLSMVWVSPQALLSVVPPTGVSTSPVVPHHPLGHAAGRLFSPSTVILYTTSVAWLALQGADRALTFGVCNPFTSSQRPRSTSKIKIGTPDRGLRRGALTKEGNTTVAKGTIVGTRDARIPNAASARGV